MTEFLLPLLTKFDLNPVLLVLGITAAGGLLATAGVFRNIFSLRLSGLLLQLFSFYLFAAVV